MFKVVLLPRQIMLSHLGNNVRIRIIYEKPFSYDSSWGGGKNRAK